MLTYHTLIEKLAHSGVDSPRLEARLILAHILQKESNSADILSIRLTEEQQQRVEDIVNRRIQKKEPLDKILGHKGFYKYDFMVNANVLSPRPDTEILLEAALDLGKKENISILDLGTGSGCILLSFLKERSSAKGIGVDISTEALDIAEKNAKKLNVVSQVSWLNKSWFDEDFIDVIGKKFDLIVSNPPYIPDAEILSLDDEVKNYDPLAALSGGDDGLVSYRRIAKIAPFLLNQNGYIFLECGLGQAQDVCNIFKAQGLELCQILKDLQGIERCIILKK